MTMKFRVLIFAGITAALSAPQSGAISALALVDKTSDQWAKYVDYSATFQQSYTDTVQNDSQVHMGKVWLCRNAGEDGQPWARLEYYEAKRGLSEDGGIEHTEIGDLIEVYFVEGETLYEYSPDEAVVTKRKISEADPRGELVLMLAMLQVDPKELRKHYDMSLVTELVLDGHDVYHLGLDPKDPTATSMPKREVWLDRQGLLPRRLLAEREGTTVQINFYTQRVDSGLDPVRDVMLDVDPDTVTMNDLTE